MTVLSAAILLFLVMDPVGNVPFYVSALRPVEPRRHVAVVIRELVIALAVMVAFLFAGAPLLAALHVSEPALSIAGGVILFLIALRMVFPPADRGAEEVAGEPFIVPLAVPYVAGPSVLATELLLVSREPERWPAWLAAVGLAWLGTAALLVLAGRFSSRLGPRALIAMERLMGMLLVAIATETFLAGVSKYLATR
jgi:small neutral amino acid transporter SnatA (MarC family)